MQLLIFVFKEGLCFLLVPRLNGHSKSERSNRDQAPVYESASVMSSELESSSFIDSEEDENASRSDITQPFLTQPFESYWLSLFVNLTFAAFGWLFDHHLGKPQEQFLSLHFNLSLLS